jgi:acyl-CoA dehydrogenase
MSEASIFRGVSVEDNIRAETERVPIEAGEVVGRRILRGESRLVRIDGCAAGPARSGRQSFLEGPVHDPCAMLDEWRITWEECDLPPEVWRIMGEQKFFGMSRRQ